jgi:hypothetical protein
LPDSAAPVARPAAISNARNSTLKPPASIKCAPRPGNNGPDSVSPQRRKPDVFGQSVVSQWRENDACFVAEDFANIDFGRTGWRKTAVRTG